MEMWILTFSQRDYFQEFAFEYLARRKRCHQLASAGNKVGLLLGSGFLVYTTEKNSGTHQISQASGEFIKRWRIVHPQAGGSRQAQKRAPTPKGKGP